MIYDDKIAKSYLEILSELDVQVSSQKTHISPHMYEFAKRWYRSGEEISGIPIEGFLKANQFW